MTAHPMTGFDPKFATPEEYILGITHEIWEQCQVDTLHEYYAPEIPVRSPASVVVGNQAVIDATNETLREFPDRELLGEDVIWSDDGAGGFLSSHRILSTATHGASGAYGEASGVQLRYRVIADCAARENTIYDEWLIRDQLAIICQLGADPRTWTERQIEAEHAAGSVVAPYTPAIEPGAVYTGTGNDHPAGQRLAEITTSVASGSASAAEVEIAYDRAAHLELPGGVSDHGWPGVDRFWGGLRACFPEADFTVHHRIGRDDPGLSERAAIRWSMHGPHAGGERFGAATGTAVYVMGITHAEFGPWGLRREWTLIDDTAIWKQLLLA